jgi:transposase
MKSEENKTKSRYTKEFKDSILKLAAESKEPLAKIANDVGVHPKTLYGWVNKEKSSKIQSDEIQERTLVEETKQLKKQLALVTQERDILKKAVAYFAKETL